MTSNGPARAHIIWVQDACGVCFSRGHSAKGDIAHYLHELLPKVDLVEVDIVRGEEFDLLDGKAWDRIFRTY